MTLSRHCDKESVARVVHQTILKILPHLAPEDISGDRSLGDQGADSVERIEIILSVMNQLGVKEPISNFSAIPNIDALVQYLWSAQQK